MSDYEFPALRDALGRLNASRKELKSIFDEAGGDLDMSKVKSIDGDSHAKVEHIRALRTKIDEQAREVQDLKAVGRVAEEAKGFEVESGAEAGGEPEGGPRFKHLGDAFTKSEAYLRKGAETVLNIEMKDLFETTDGWPPESTRSGRVELTPQRPAPHVVNFIPTSTINQPLYKYMEETTFATNSGDSDNLAGMTSEGGTFTEAELNLTERSLPVEKVTVWLPMTDEQLEDVGGASAYVRQRLTYMIQAKVDKEVLTGSGTPPHLRGTENVSGIQTQAKGADTIPDAVYKLFTSIRTDGFAEPNVVFINPSKWQDVALLKTADGIYIWGHPSTVGPLTLWGVPVVLTTAHTSTKAIAGDYATYANLFTKRGLTVQTTNAHSTYFIEGKQAIRADARMVVVHHRPKAFGVVTGL
jgi:HK97 family phage major capsid protein